MYGWKSSTVAKIYVADSLCIKKEVVNTILHNEALFVGFSNTFLRVNHSDYLEENLESHKHDRNY